MEKTGTLYVVATPIGNLEDITMRALRILKEADYVLCEDTRVTGKLLAHYEIKTTLRRYDAHTSEQVHESIIADLESGKQIALVSDAGTPGISDPGVFLIARIRKIGGIRIDAVPGPSAVTAAFSIAGLTGNQFSFLGFVPQKKGRQTFFAELKNYEHPVVFFESTHRIMKTLESLKEYLPNPAPVPKNPRTDLGDDLGEIGKNPEVGPRVSPQVTVARELTKLFEEVVQGTAAEVFEYFTTNPDHVRGEFVVLVKYY